jgi:hypothetical protein
LRLSEYFVVAGCQWASVSESVFFTAGLTVNKKLYISKCLAVLHKFIQKHHKKENFVFWPDLTPDHYAKDTLARLEEPKINYVPNEENSLSVPQLWPIENYRPKVRKMVKCLMAKIRKELKSIKTTRMGKAMKEVPA